MYVPPGQSVNLPAQSSIWAFVYVMNCGDQNASFWIGDQNNIVVVQPYPNYVTTELPFGGGQVRFCNSGSSALSICCVPPNVDPWWNGWGKK
jgi:hypothetical protein